MNEALVLLLLLWAVVLLPGALRSRKSSPHTTVGGFERAMDVLRARPGQGREVMVPGDAGRIVERDDPRRSAPREAAGPGGGDPVVARRRAWFLRLLAGTGATLLLAVVLGGWLWLAFVAVAGITGGYTALLRHLKLQHDQARRVVRELDLGPGRRRSAGGLDDGADGEGDGRIGEAGNGLHGAVASGEMAVGSTVRLRRWDS